MKFLAASLAILAVSSISLAQSCGSNAAPSGGAATFNGPSSVVKQSQGKQTELTAEAREFVKNGPTVFKNMDQAIALSEKTGKRVVCWVSEDRSNPLVVFNDREARRVSQELDATTIQVAMGTNPAQNKIDRDGKRLPPRVEFSSSNYGATAETAYIPLKNLKADSGDKILAFARGSSQLK